MKYAIVIPDGVGDWPLDELGGKTPLEAAKKSNLDSLSQNSILGTLKTCPDGMYPGSDVCGLSLFGYNPKEGYTGRAPLEAANLNLLLKPGELAFRCNLVSEENGVLTDYSADHITTEEAEELVHYLEKNLGSAHWTFHPGKMYRHILIFNNAKDFEGVKTAQPHDFQGQVYATHKAQGKGADILMELTEKSKAVLANHPVNEKREKCGKKRANMIWLWGGGGAPKLETFHKRFGVKGGVISAVDLLNGIGRYLDLEIINVPGATGYFDTDYRAKGRYAIDALNRLDFVAVHVEATDEAGHSGNAKEKVKAIEQIDEHIVGPLVAHMKKSYPEFRIYVAPDHYTPTIKKTHVAEAVPFILSGTDIKQASKLTYSEVNAQKTGVKLEDGSSLMRKLIGGWNKA